MEQKKRLNKSMKDKVLLVVLCIFGILAIVSGGLIFKYYHDSKVEEQQYLDIALLYDEIIKEEKITEDEAVKKDESVANEVADSIPDNGGLEEPLEELGDSYSDTNIKTKVTSTDIQAINPDYVGFVKVPGTNINYPIVQRDNSYYLSHNFWGKASKAGSIFLDENCVMSGDLLLIHGHHMKSGAMFGSLSRYKNTDYIAKHSTVTLNDGTGETEYTVFAVSLVDLTREDYFDFSVIPTNYTEKVAYINGILNTSIWKADNILDYDYSQKIVLLSTCEYGTENERLIVMAIQK